MITPNHISPQASPLEFIQIHRISNDAIRAELSAGLLAEQASTAPKYLYDELGSKLFAAICELPEYYLTRTEAAIFSAYLDEMVECAGRGVTLIDLGAGNCAKAARLFAALQPAHYVAVDISTDFLHDALGLLQQRFPNIKMTGIGLDFSSALQFPDVVRPDKRLFFYPGSSIGNFTPDEALSFFKGLRATCSSDGGVLLGVDLIKDKKVLDAAYDDALGVTAAFNLNMLLHLNKLLGANFDVRDWQHRGFFNAKESRIEMHLEAKRAVKMTWTGGERNFKSGERIHTENSYKYTRNGVVKLLQQAGFRVDGMWRDQRDWFMVCYARAV